MHVCCCLYYLWPRTSDSWLFCLHTLSMLGLSEPKDSERECKHLMRKTFYEPYRNLKKLKVNSLTVAKTVPMTVQRNCSLTKLQRKVMRTLSYLAQTAQLLNIRIQNMDNNAIALIIYTQFILHNLPSPNTATLLLRTFWLLELPTQTWLHCPYISLQ